MQELTVALRLIYILLILIAIPSYLFIAYKTFKQWQENRKLQTFSFGLIFFGGGLGVFFLMLEQAILELTFADLVAYPLGELPTLAGDPTANIARILVSIAIIFSAISVIGSNLFVLSFLDENKLKLIYPIALIEVIYALLYYLLDFVWVRKEDVWEYSHADNDATILLLFLIPVFSSVIFLIYATWNGRKTSRFQFNRLLLLTIGQTIIGFGYIVQVISPSIFSALAITIYSYWMYFVFFTPEWLKEKLS